jgi:large subunit ribosomal protein L22
MDAKATHYAAKCTARKARLLRPLILGKTVTQAIAILSVGRRAGSVATVKLIRSALAQLPDNSSVHTVISDFVVNEGPRRRMFMPRAQGRATPVLKKTSHLTIRLKLN